MVERGRRPAAPCLPSLLPTPPWSFPPRTGGFSPCAQLCHAGTLAGMDSLPTTCCATMRCSSRRSALNAASVALVESVTITSIGMRTNSAASAGKRVVTPFDWRKIKHDRPSLGVNSPRYAPRQIVAGFRPAAGALPAGLRFGAWGRRRLVTTQAPDNSQRARVQLRAGKQLHDVAAR